MRNLFTWLNWLGESLLTFYVSCIRIHKPLHFHVGKKIDTDWRWSYFTHRSHMIRISPTHNFRMWQENMEKWKDDQPINFPITFTNPNIFEIFIYLSLVVIFFVRNRINFPVSFCFSASLFPLQEQEEYEDPIP